MRRRRFIALLGGAMAAAPAAGAQQNAMPVIGFLGVSSGRSDALAWFQQGLGDTGYVEGQNVAIEYRSWEGRRDRLPAVAADLVALKVDVIAATGGTLAALAAKNATSAIPILFASGGDPVRDRLVASFARPGGNLTGVTILTGELNPKRLELLSELVPQARVIGLLINPTGAAPESNISAVQQAARTKNIQIAVVRAAADDEFETAFASLARLHAGALLVGNDPFFNSRREQLVVLASRYAVPAIYEWRDFAEAGGLISYGTRRSDAYRQMGAYAGMILKGAKPADLPVVQPTRFELVINLKTAKALGLAVPPILLAQADEVIE